jgi:hypothetical protein
VQIKPCETLRGTPQTLRQNKKLHPVQIKPCETLRRTPQTLLQKRAPPSTNQTLRNAAQNTANPASKKEFHQVKLQTPQNLT